MPLVTLQTIDGPEQVIADVFEVFAVHNTLKGERGHFTLTHIPSGMAYLRDVSYEHAVAAAREILDSGLDWGIEGQHELTDAHKAQGRDFRARYPPIDATP